MERHVTFPNINGLRFIGSLGVLVFHCYMLNREIWGDFYQEYWFQKAYILISRGHHGVALFFIISGFLITYLLLNERSKGNFHLGRYLMRRFLRVWPLYFLVVLFGFFVFPHLPYGITTVHEFWRYALFLSNFDELINGMNDSINFLTATWTVSVEEQFYLAWGVLIGVVAFRKKAAYVWLFLLVLLGSLWFRMEHFDQHRILHYHTLSVMANFAIGGLAGLWTFTGGAQKLFENMPRYVIVLVYLVGCSLILFEDHLFKGIVFAFEQLVFGTFFAFVILEQVFSKRSFFKADRIPGFYQSGKITYGFYLFHCLFIYYWAMFFRDHGYTDHIGWYLLFVVLVFVSTYLMAWISYLAMEKPVLKLKKYFR